MITIHHADCIAAMRAMPAESVDACVTDAPYGLGKEPPIAEVLAAWLAGDVYKPRGSGFMGREWDAYVPGPEVWREVFRVLKPGGHLLSFFGTRTYDVGTLAIRLAGFEVRDQIDWLYGQGMPHGFNMSRADPCTCGALDGGALRGRGECQRCGGLLQALKGFSTELKPGHEPICVARKPLAGTVELNVRRYGTGAINIGGCRVGDEEVSTHSRGSNGAFPKRTGEKTAAESGRKKDQRDGLDTVSIRTGRWPANVVIDEEAAAMIDAQSGIQKDGVAVKRNTAIGKVTGHIFRMGNTGEDVGYGGEGGASRFFYVAKASGSDRGEENIHETVKPLSLMRWLVRLVTPPGGLVLDPFAGSGTTGLAAMAEGMSAIIVEREADYVAVIRSRLAGACDVVEGDGRREATERKRKKREQIGLFG